jgi:hypothetical protein
MVMRRRRVASARHLRIFGDHQRRTVGYQSISRGSNTKLLDNAVYAPHDIGEAGMIPTVGFERKGSAVIPVIAASLEIEARKVSIQRSEIPTISSTNPGSF